MSRALPCLFAALALLGSAQAALAGQPVNLRPDVADEEGRVTLGDLFDAAGEASAVVVAAGRAGSGLVLDAGHVQMIARANGLDWNNATGIRRIIVRPGLSPNTVTVVASRAVVSRPGVDVLSYTHNINTGEIVHADDLAWTKAVAANPDAPRAPQAVIGMAARRPLREGSAVGMNDVSAPLVIKKDDIISLVYSADGVTVTLQAKALDSANAGQTFKAMNPESKKIIQAVAVGPGQAMVGPRADQYAAAARLDPALIASIR
jgi:flagella basal body P-ring formation protein FlgA